MKLEGLSFAGFVAPWPGGLRINAGNRNNFLNANQGQLVGCSLGKLLGGLCRNEILKGELNKAGHQKIPEFLIHFVFAPALHPRAAHFA